MPEWAALSVCPLWHLNLHIPPIYLELMPLPSRNILRLPLHFLVETGNPMMSHKHTPFLLHLQHPVSVPKSFYAVKDGAIKDIYFCSIGLTRDGR